MGSVYCKQSGNTYATLQEADTAEAGQHTGEVHFVVSGEVDGDVVFAGLDYTSVVISVAKGERFNPQGRTGARHSGTLTASCPTTIYGFRIFRLGMGSCTDLKVYDSEIEATKTGNAVAVSLSTAYVAYMYNCVIHNAYRGVYSLSSNANNTLEKCTLYDISNLGYLRCNCIDTVAIGVGSTDYFSTTSQVNTWGEDASAQNQITDGTGTFVDLANDDVRIRADSDAGMAGAGAFIEGEPWDLFEGFDYGYIISRDPSETLASNSATRTSWWIDIEQGKSYDVILTNSTRSRWQYKRNDGVNRYGGDEVPSPLVPSDINVEMASFRVYYDAIDDVGATIEIYEVTDTGGGDGSIDVYSTMDISSGAIDVEFTKPTFIVGAGGGISLSAISKVAFVKPTYNVNLSSILVLVGYADVDAEPPAPEIDRTVNVFSYAPTLSGSANLSTEKPSYSVEAVGSISLSASVDMSITLPEYVVGATGSLELDAAVSIHNGNVQYFTPKENIVYFVAKPRIATYTTKLRNTDG